LKRKIVIFAGASLIAVGAVWLGFLRQHGAPAKKQETAPSAAEAEAAAPALKPEDRIGPAWEDPRNPIAQLFKGKRLDLWSLRPIQNPTPPGTKDAWARNEVDQFVLARLQKEGLTPAPEADRRTLARRLYFDLTGLPPSFEEVEAFAGSADPNACEKLVDKLLASRAFGEHWGRWWLDVVRYSDSNGYDWDEFRPQAWRFRDYVIRSLNADKPMNRFIREQLAGDEMLASFEMKTEEQQDCLTATGYLRAGPHDHSAEKFGEAQRDRAHMTADLVETTGAAFLGLTLNCARCHDHKTDPISQEDHYRMRAFFETVKYRDDLSVDFAKEKAAVDRFNMRFKDELQAAQAEVDKTIASARQRYLESKIERGMKLKGNDLMRITEEEALKHASEEERADYDKAKMDLGDVRRKMMSYALPPSMTDGDDLNPKSYILAMGDPDQPKAEVTVGFLSALDPNPVTLLKPVNPASSGRRTTLANWILSDTNPLTTRVLANRIWLGVFGRGIVATPNDFGYSGSRPSHPELLDWLATRLRKDHWSLKSMIRLLVTSATYRESSQNPQLADAQAKDADNRLLWRHDLRRLTAEQLRDAILCVSGQMQEHAGGPPLWPTLPADLAESNPSLKKEAENAERTKNWYPSSQDQLNVRSIYLVQKRTVRVPFMETFDLPDNFTTCPVRNVSTVAPQALTLMNGAFTIEASRAFAKRLGASGQQSPDQEVNRAFELALQRTPSPDESSVGRQVAAQESGLVELARLVFNMDAFIYVD
jgi:hypothetical protein